MTVYYRLIQNTTTVDFIGGTAKMSLDGYQQYADGNRVTEVFTIVVEATTRALVRAALNDVFEMLEAAERWHETGLEYYPVWLRNYTDGETAKQALVYGYDLAPVVFRGISHQLETGDGKYTTWNLAITRDREWEAITDTDVSAAAISALGGHVDFTTTTGGQVDMRIASLRISAVTANTTKIWAGIHRPRNVDFDADLFAGRFDIDSVYASVDATSGVADANGYGGDAVEVDFDTIGDWRTRCYALLPDNSPNSPAHSLSWVGRWLVLLRARTTSTRATMAQLTVSVGVPGTGNLMVGSPVYIEDVDYTLYEMGEIQLPLWGYRTSDFAETMKQVRLNIAARSVSGAGSLMVDCFVMIPAEHMVVWTAGMVGATDPGAYIETQEDGKTIGVVAVGTSPNITVGDTAALTTRNWRFPKEGGVLIVAAQREAGVQTITDTMSINLALRKRYLGYVE